LLEKVRGWNAYSGDLFNLIVGQLEGQHDNFLDPLVKATAILLEALQELRLEVLLSDQVRLALLLTEMMFFGINRLICPQQSRQKMC